MNDASEALKDISVPAFLREPDQWLRIPSKNSHASQLMSNDSCSLARDRRQRRALYHDLSKPGKRISDLRIYEQGANGKGRRMKGRLSLSTFPVLLPRPVRQEQLNFGFKVPLLLTASREVREGNTYHQPNNFHQATPNTVQIRMFVTEATKPRYHHVRCFT